MAGGLVAAALLVLAALPLVNRRYRPAAEATAAEGPAGAIGFVDEQLGHAVQQVGPLGILATAFAIGVLAARRADRS